MKRALTLAVFMAACLGALAQGPIAYTTDPKIANGVTYIPGGWSAQTNYAVNDTVLYSGQIWLSKVSPNTGNTPAAGSTYWMVYGGGGGGTVSPATASTPGVVQLANGQTSSQLAPVATSGSYTDLLNKPTIPPAVTAAGTAATQVQIRKADGTFDASAVTMDPTGNVRVPGTFAQIGSYETTASAGATANDEEITIEGSGQQSDYNSANNATSFAHQRIYSFVNAGQNIWDPLYVQCPAAGDCVGDKYLIGDGGTTMASTEATRESLYVGNTSFTPSFTCQDGCTTGSQQVGEGFVVPLLGVDRFLEGPSTWTGTVDTPTSIGGGAPNAYPFATAHLAGRTDTASVFYESSASHVSGSNITVSIKTTGFSFASLPMSGNAGTIPVGTKMCFAIPARSGTYGYFTRATVTAVTSTSITFDKLRYPHPAGSILAYGGLCGQGVNQTANDAGNIAQIFPVVGSVDNAGTVMYDSFDTGEFLAVNGATLYNSSTANGATLSPIARISSYTAPKKNAAGTFTDEGHVGLEPNDVPFTTNGVVTVPAGMGMNLNGRQVEVQQFVAGTAPAYGYQSQLDDYSAAAPGFTAPFQAYFKYTKNIPGQMDSFYYGGPSTNPFNKNTRNGIHLQTSPSNALFENTGLLDGHVYSTWDLPSWTGGANHDHAYQETYDPTTGNRYYTGLFEAATIQSFVGNGSSSVNSEVFSPYAGAATMSLSASGLTQSGSTPENAYTYTWYLFNGNSATDRTGILGLQNTHSGLWEWHIDSIGDICFLTPGNTTNLNACTGAKFRLNADGTSSGFGGGGTAITLQTNGTNNGSQSTLNLAAGTGITLSNSGGTTTITSTGTTPTQVNRGVLTLAAVNGSTPQVSSATVSLSGYTSAPVCTASDQTAIAAVQVAVTGSASPYTLTVYAGGSVTDKVAYSCGVAQ